MPNSLTPAPTVSEQLKFDFGIEVEREVAGIEMGVLDNGIPYLTQRGIATMSGAARSTIQELSQEWEKAQESGYFPSGRMQYFKDQLAAKGYDDEKLFFEIEKNGQPHYAYPDVVSVVIIEYFAFEAQKTNEIAVKNFRALAKHGLQQFIYEALGYKPVDKWFLFNSRVSLLKDSVPSGYFGIFKETTGIVVDLINSGLTVDHNTLPDGSVGGVWGRHWTANEFDKKFGDRIEYPHYYPKEYPQSASNPQSAWAYPNESWPYFQEWLRTVYLPTKYPVYILKKANILPGGKLEAQKLAALFNSVALESK